MQKQTITIDPITRLEGTARSTSSWTARARSSAHTSRCRNSAGSRPSALAGRRGHASDHQPDLRVCPTAHHMAATRALDDLYKVEPPPTATKIRDLIYNTFMLEDHALHVYILGGPDFIVGPDAPRNCETWSG